MVSIPIYHVDAFTDRAFSGNPAAVCLLKSEADEEWMQQVAAEMNLSETAFLVRENDGYRLRWFTPASEVDLCGHATLASTHVLSETGKIQNSIRFFTKSGTLTAHVSNGSIRLDFPGKPQQKAKLPEGAEEALGVEPVYVGRNEFDYMVEVASEQQVREMNPDFSRLRKMKARGFIVTSQSQSNPYDFISRFFATGVGVDEDPVTGSAHCCLAPYWANKLGKSEFTAYQASERGGTIQLKVDGDRVHLTGKAVTVLKGELFT